MKMGCLNCKEPVVQSVGKRKKLYCSDKCRVEYYRKKKADASPNKRSPGRPRKKANNKAVVKSETRGKESIEIAPPSKKVSGNSYLNERLQLKLGIKKGKKQVDDTV